MGLPPSKLGGVQKTRAVPPLTRSGTARTPVGASGRPSTLMVPRPAALRPGPSETETVTVPLPEESLPAATVSTHPLNDDVMPLPLSMRAALIEHCGLSSGESR